MYGGHTLEINLDPNAVEINLKKNDMGKQVSRFLLWSQSYLLVNKQRFEIVYKITWKQVELASYFCDL